MINLEKEKNKACDACGKSSNELYTITAKKSKNSEKRTRLCLDCMLNLNNNIQKLLFSAKRQ